MTDDIVNPYHLNPVATGSARVDDAPCVLCGRSDTAKYEGEAVFNDDGVDSEQICVVCINDGTAHARLGATFTGHFALDDGWAGVPAAVTAHIRERTPAVFTWQAPRWLACCGDAAVYLGVVDEDGDAVARSTSDAERVEPLLLAAGNSAPSWYLFRCQHCAAHLSFADEP